VANNLELPPLSSGDVEPPPPPVTNGPTFATAHQKQPCHNSPAARLAAAAVVENRAPILGQLYDMGVPFTLTSFTTVSYLRANCYVPPGEPKRIFARASLSSDAAPTLAVIHSP
jgi:hypothetical protein